ncbi:hypothetical protein ABT299_14595 [Spirillospora sp. NPDC000708]|uniref:hypothetical protein n=1 Tax=Actinomadura sp. RB99 TaxID=2691577 RepID=UPI0016898BBA|nr:hypothetical protein [Actinomadura sp. RB99]MBD2894510.1 Chromosome partition protein Smc [Actinomadura sp. RB99]
MHDDQDGLPAAGTEALDLATAPLRPLPDDPAGGDEPEPEAPAGAAAEEAGPGICQHCARPLPPGASRFCSDAHREAHAREAERRDAAGTAALRTFGDDVERLGDMVVELVKAAAALGERLDGEVRGAIDGAEEALAEARAERTAAAAADARTREAEARAEAARAEAAAAIEELQKGMAAAKASVAAAQESEAGAWKEAGAAQQARATAANEAAQADGLRKHAEAAWRTEHQARTDAENERDALAGRLAGEQTALATAHAELKEARAELDEARSRLDAAAETERRLREELTAAQAEAARLTAERESATARADEQAARADRAERLADETAARAEGADARIERAERRAEIAAERADRDAATVRSLQGTLRAALDLPAVEELGEGQGVKVGEAGAVIARPGGLIGVEQVPDVLDSELAARFARAVLAVRVHQATQRALQDTAAEPSEADDGDGP